jgi:hypothetical protein
MFSVGALSFRDMPLPAAWQRVSGQGHAGSVVVASWDRQYAGDGGVWGSGTFLDPRIVPEVVEAIYLLEKRLIGPSVDLDPDLAYEVVDHPVLVGEYAMQVTRATTHGVTFVQGPAFPQVHITVDDDEEMAILASAGISIAEFAVNKSSWHSWPVAERETKWNFEDAINRIAIWAGGDAKKFSSAFLYQDKSTDPNNRESYRAPLADVVNGELVLIPRAVMAAATMLSGGHGGFEDVPEPERIQMQQVITEIYDSLREQYGDPRFIAPWQRGGRAGATSSEGQPTEASMEAETFAVRSSGWSSMPTSTGTWDEGAARAALDSWAGDDMAKYGRAFLWSDGSGNKTGFKFPIARPVDGTLTIFIRAVNNADARLSQADIPAADKTRIQGVIDSIQARYGGEDEEAALTAAGVLAPPKTWFDDPKLTKKTMLRITEDGRVFGHLATWDSCHTGVGNKCVRAPRSKTGYRHFKTGTVLTAEGQLLKVGKITLGTGHADKKWGLIPAVEHYDNTGHCAAVVNAGEDKFGPWVAGALVAGLSEERIAELRRSPLSGDWRGTDGNLELVAALAVNNPGFPVLEEDADGVVSLTAAGVLELPEGDDVQPSDFSAGPDLAEVDAFLAAFDRAERVAAVERAYHDLLPDVTDCGCNG